MFSSKVVYQIPCRCYHQQASRNETKNKIAVQLNIPCTALVGVDACLVLASLVGDNTNKGG
jgi:hypothetical protein